jgi:hypothetical protein
MFYVCSPRANGVGGLRLRRIACDDVAAVVNRLRDNLGAAVVLSSGRSLRRGASAIEVFNVSIVEDFGISLCKLKTIAAHDASLGCGGTYG